MWEREEVSEMRETERIDLITPTFILGNRSIPFQCDVTQENTHPTTIGVIDIKSLGDVHIMDRTVGARLKTVQ